MKKLTDKQKTILKRVLFGIQCALIIVCVIFSIIVVANPGGFNDDKSGKRSLFMTVESDSMSPTIDKNDLIITDKPIETGHYDLGTVVTFVDKAGGLLFYNTHRIVGYRYFDQTGKYVEGNVVYLKVGTLETIEQFESLYPNYTFHSYVTRGDKYTLEKAGKTDISQVTDFSIGADKDDNIVHVNSTIVAQLDYTIGGLGGALKWLRDPSNFFLVIILPLILLFAYNIFSMVRIIVKGKIQKAKDESKIDENEIKRQAIKDYFMSTGLSIEEATNKAYEQFPIKTETKKEENNADEPVLEDNKTEEISQENIEENKE